MGRVDSSDIGKQALVNGISLEGKHFRGAAEIEDVRSDVFGDAVAVRVDGETHHFRQRDIGDVLIEQKTQGGASAKSSGCLLIPLLLGMLGVLAAYAGVHHLLI